MKDFGRDLNWSQIAVEAFEVAMNKANGAEHNDWDSIADNEPEWTPRVHVSYDGETGRWCASSGGTEHFFSGLRALKEYCTDLQTVLSLPCVASVNGEATRA